MRESLHRVERTLYQTSNIGRLVAEFLLGGIVAVTVVDIFLRYVLNRPLAYSVELVELGLAIIVFCSIIVCTAQRGHINLNIILTKFPQRSQASINSFIYIICTVVFAVIAWRGVIYAMQLKDMGQVSMMLKLPFYPFVFVIAVCSFLTCLIFLSQFVHFVNEAVRK